MTNDEESVTIVDPFDDLFEPAEPSARWPAQGGIPSTLHELRGRLIEYEATRARTVQTELGPSELGTPCAQQIARKLVAGPQPPAQEPAWAPLQGTAVHNTMDDVIDFWNLQEGRERWLPKRRLHIAPAEHGLPAVSGEADAYDTDHQMVVDWKHTGVTALKDLRTARSRGLPLSQQVGAEYRVQAHLYGYGYRQLGYPVAAVRLVFLARSWKFDDSDEWTEPYDEQVALSALVRYFQIVRRVGELDLDMWPDAIANIPATPSSKCWWCPFRAPGRPADRDGCPGK